MTGRSLLLAHTDKRKQKYEEGVGEASVWSVASIWSVASLRYSGFRLEIY